MDGTGRFDPASKFGNVRPKNQGRFSVFVRFRVLGTSLDFRKAMLPTRWFAVGED